MENIKRKGNHTTHGKRSSKIYNVWSNMKQRCYNKKVKCYKYYGGKGIEMCEEWKSDFSCFYNWMVENNWHTGLEIDRIDNSKGYNPDNCRLITHKKNMLNQDRIIKVTIDGKEYSLKDYCQTFGVSYGMLLQRVRKLGWPLEKALAVKKNEIRRHKKP